jgi:adenosylcobinamide-phosphate guanylyltransferase
MEALVMAGGKGTRMGSGGIEKPLTVVGGKHTVCRVIDALKGTQRIDRVLVSVSSNTPSTEKYLKDRGVETIRTSGESFVDDIHTAFQVMNGKYVMYAPSDLPLLRSYTVEAFVDYFTRYPCESMLAVVDKETVVKTGITPSFSFDIGGTDWVISGLSILDRQKILNGDLLTDSYFKTDWVDLAINVNTKYELQMARGFYSDHDIRY